MNRRRTVAVLLAALVLPAVGLAQNAPASQALAAELDAYITKGMRDWKIPGLSIAVVKADAVVYAKGFGVRKIGAPEPVDSQTLFGMMSTTKAMTALAIALLADEKKVSWDDPVTKHLPWFQLSDPWVTRELTVRDLLRHNAGLGNADLLAGTYDHPVWGDVVVAPAGDGLTVRIGPRAEQSGRLEHWHLDTFRGKLGDGRGGWTYFTFRIGGDGTASAVRLEDQGPFEFVRRKVRQ